MSPNGFVTNPFSGHVQYCLTIISIKLTPTLECFLCFLYCTNGIKLRKATHIQTSKLIRSVNQLAGSCVLGT